MSAECRRIQPISATPSNLTEEVCHGDVADLVQRLHCNILTVALANKLARIALTVLVKGRNYETRIRPVAA
jgi:hypothetical protein